MRATIRTNGIRGPAQGLPVTILRNVPANSIYLGSFEVIKDQLAKSKGCTQAELPAWQVISAGVCCTSGPPGQAYLCTHTPAVDKLAGQLSQCAPMCCHHCVHLFIMLCLAPPSSHALAAIMPYIHGARSDPLVIGCCCAGGVGGLMYWMTVYPLDVIKSAQMTDAIEPSQRKYPTIAVAFRVSSMAARLFADIFWLRRNDRSLSHSKSCISAETHGRGWHWQVLQGVHTLHCPSGACKRHHAVDCRQGKPDDEKLVTSPHAHQKWHFSMALDHARYSPATAPQQF